MSGGLDIKRLFVKRDGGRTLALRDLAIQPGEVVGLTGPSGSGKSTAARALVGLAEADEIVERDAHYDDRDIGVLGLGTGIGLVFQDPFKSLDPLMRAGDHVVEALRYHFKLSRREAWTAARRVFARVGLPDDDAFLRRYPHQLSGGQRQRVAIAAAISLKPRVLVADEPTSALDVIAQRHIAHLLQALARELAMAVLFIGHDLGLLSQICDRLVVLSAGEVVEAGATRRIISAPEHDVTKRLVDAARATPLNAGRDTDTPQVLEARAVVRHYAGLNRPAVDGASFQVRSGEALGIVGESGSGKSTLARTLLALEAADAGEVYLDGHPFSPYLSQAVLRPLRRRIQAVFQDPAASFDPLWSVERLVAEPLHLLGSTSKDDVRFRTIAVLERVGFGADILSRRPHQFSGGEKQKLALARALVLDPAVLVLDEALSALDTVSRRQILQQLQALKAQGLALVFVSHDLASARTIADRIVVMRDGRIVEQGETPSVFEAPKAPYTRELLEASPSLS